MQLDNKRYVTLCTFQIFTKLSEVEYLNSFCELFVDVFLVVVVVVVVVAAVASAVASSCICLKIDHTGSISHSQNLVTRF